MCCQCLTICFAWSQGRASVDEGAVERGCDHTTAELDEPRSRRGGTLESTCRFASTYFSILTPMPVLLKPLISFAASEHAPARELLAVSTRTSCTPHTLHQRRPGQGSSPSPFTSTTTRYDDQIPSADTTGNPPGITHCTIAWLVVPQL